MKFIDDTPELGEFVTPYPKYPPVRNILKEKHIPGKLIVFEGPDGSGKSTQVQLLKEKLIKSDIQATTFSYIKSNLIRHTLLKGKWENYDPFTSTFIYLTALTDLMNREILPRLYNGEIVILDRYIYSIIGKGVVRGIKEEWFHSFLHYLFQPHFTIYIDTPVDICWQRKDAKGSSPSYWECGMDMFPDDQLRYRKISELSKDCFITYQNNMKHIIKNQIPKQNSLIINGENEIRLLNKKIYLKTISLIEQ